jgi:hypothetical protein
MIKDCAQRLRKAVHSGLVRPMASGGGSRIYIQRARDDWTQSLTVVQGIPSSTSVC